MILKSLKGEIETLEIPDRAIRRLRDSLIVTMSVPKRFCVTEDKRMLPSQDFIMYPYGYKV